MLAVVFAIRRVVALVPAVMQFGLGEHGDFLQSISCRLESLNLPVSHQID